MKYKLMVMNKKEPIMLETKDRIENEIPEIKKVFEDNGTGDEISELLYNHYSNQICCPKDEFKLIGWDLIKDEEDGTKE